MKIESNFVIKSKRNKGNLSCKFIWSDKKKIESQWKNEFV